MNTENDTISHGILKDCSFSSLDWYTILLFILSKLRCSPKGVQYCPQGRELMTRRVFISLSLACNYHSSKFT